MLKALRLKPLTILLLTVTMIASTSAETLTLTDGWLVQSSAKVNASGDILSTDFNPTGWHQATVPSTIMGVLTSDGTEPEALTATDYQRIDRRQFDTSWWYRTTFTLPKQQSGSRVLLLFDGISYRANVWLNGRQVADSQTLAGPFRQFSIDITPYVQTNNILAVEVIRAQPGEPNIGFVDWNPRPADESMGIFREVRVKTCGAVSVSHTAVRSRVNTETLDEAWLTIDTELTNLGAEPVSGLLRGTVDGREYTCSVTLQPHERRLVTLVSDVHIPHPRLWWCHTLGNPELYDLHMAFLADGSVSDTEDLRFGIREIHSYLTDEGHRGFTLNGRNVLLRGAGWTDDIYLRDTPATNRLQLEYVRHMNLNTVRLEGFWGTSQNLYDLCDELGLLVLAGWSCHWEWADYLGAPCDERYGGITTPALTTLIGQSFEDQVLWLRRHPSIIGWFVGSDMLPVPDLERRYQQFLSQYDDRPYIVSAKQVVSTVSGPSGTKMAGPYEYVSPSYWYDPQAPGGAFGFNTETGIGAQLPVRESLERMLGTLEDAPSSKWNFLCTASSSAMNSIAKLSEVIDARFGSSPDIDTWLHRADLLNYESTRAMFEAFRVRVPRATGIIQWMLNSARPSIYWQLYDYYKQPNAAYYAVKRANAPVQLIYDYHRHTVYAVNETMEPVTIKAQIELFKNSTKNEELRTKNYGSTKNEELRTKSYDYQTSADSSAESNHNSSLFTLNSSLKDYSLLILNSSLNNTSSLVPGAVEPIFTLDLPASPSFLLLRACTADGQLLAANDYFLAGENDEYDWSKTDWTTTPISHYASYRELSEACDASGVSLTAIPSLSHPHTYEVTVTNTSTHVAFFLRLTAQDEEGRLACPAFWSDNYLTLAPGERRTVTCHTPDTDQITFNISKQTSL